MPEDASQSEVRVTVDGAEFYSFVRALKRGYPTSHLGEVMMSAQGGKLTIETKKNGCVLVCNETPRVVARLSPGSFCRLASLIKDARATGPLVIVFRPEFGEVSLPHAGAKAMFDD